MMMDEKALLKAICCSTTEVFSTMLNLNVTPGSPYLETFGPDPSDGIITIVGLAGTWVGTGSLCCNSRLALRIASRMLCAEYEEVNEDVLDAMSEITNMVIGNFKTEAEMYLGPLGLSIPTVIYGLNFVLRSAVKERWTVVPFTCEGESLDVKICIAPNRGLPRINHAPVGLTA